MIRAVVRFALQRFYRLELVRRTEALDGPLMLVGNHPNSLVDPALVFVVTPRHVTFLAREPLFRAPVLGWLLKGLGALPVYRKQDHPGLMAKNEGTLDAAATALAEGRAITIFPEGKSHSEPQLSEIKTGCARIALKAVRAGATPRIVPVGITYAQKHRFRSRVHLEVGEALVLPPAPAGEAEEVAWVQQVTTQVAEAMRRVTLNLEEWADLGLVQTAEQLYALRLGEKARDPERLRRFAQGVAIFRREQPERFEPIRDEVLSFSQRLELVRADAGDLALQYRRPEVLRFVGRSLASLFFGLPLFAVGLVLYCIPFYAVRYSSRLVPLAKDRVATFKLVGALVMTPLWQALLSWAAWRLYGVSGLVVSLLGALPLAMFTRYFIERWRGALRDVQTFFVLGNRARLKALLLVEGERLAAEIEKVAAELRPRVTAPPAGSA